MKNLFHLFHDLRFYSCLGLSLAFCISSCNTSSETGNPTPKNLTGTVYSQDGSIALNTRIQFIPENFNPLDSLNSSTGKISIIVTDITDKNGQVHFQNLDSGSYNVEAVQISSGKRARLKNISVIKSIPEKMNFAFSAPAKLRCIFADSLTNSDQYVFVKGSSFKAKIPTGSKEVILDSLPSGLVDSISFGNRSEPSQIKPFAWGIELHSDTQNVLASYIHWKYSTAVAINTMPSGVPINNAVTGFPLRIDLAKTQFDFTTATKDGSDIRATNERGYPLPCELQGWNADLHQGQIWIKVDSISPNSLKKIRLFSGAFAKDILISQWPMGSVFSKENGFISSWHLDEDPGKTNGMVQDNSGQKNNGLAIGYPPSSPTNAGTANSGAVNAPGIVGNGLLFDGKNQFIATLQNFQAPNTFTFTGWFKSTAANGGRLINFVDPDTALLMNNFDRLITIHANGRARFGLYPPVSTQGQVGSYKIFESANNSLDGQWHFFAAKLSSNGASFFLDSVKVGEDKGITSGQNFNGFWRLGEGDQTGWAPVGTSNFFEGIMDEVWIAHAEFSDDFIKLSYENQKVGSVLVKSGK